jgi:hypothetical protein
MREGVKFTLDVIEISREFMWASKFLREFF